MDTTTLMLLEYIVTILTTTKGTEHPCSAEQLLSHLLPVIAGIKGKNVLVKVEPDNKIKT